MAVESEQPLGVGQVRVNGEVVNVDSDLLTLMRADPCWPRIDVIEGHKIDQFPHFGVTDLRVITGVAAPEPVQPELTPGFDLVHVIRREAVAPGDHS